MVAVPRHLWDAIERGENDALNREAPQMPQTIVRCSEPGCRKDAETKIAAPWKGGRFSELKTYGYACSDHTESMMEYARKRPRPASSTEESVGDVGAYSLAPH